MVFISIEWSGKDSLWGWFFFFMLTGRKYCNQTSQEFPFQRNISLALWWEVGKVNSSLELEVVTRMVLKGASSRQCMFVVFKRVCLKKKGSACLWKGVLTYFLVSLSLSPWADLGGRERREKLSLQGSPSITFVGDVVMPDFLPKINLSYDREIPAWVFRIPSGL